MYKMALPERPIKIFVPSAYVFTLVLLAVLVVVHALTKIPFAMFTADPAASMNYNSLFGYISNIGILFWCVTATVCFLSASILNIRTDQGEIIRFLVMFGALTAVLMLDDLFMFHESLAPAYFHIPEKAMLALYGAYAMFCFMRFHKVILSHDISHLIVSVVCFGLSVVMDQISEKIYLPGEYLFEDGAKFLGIAAWMVYFVHFSFTNIMTVLAQSQIEIIRGRSTARSRKKASLN